MAFNPFDERGIPLERQVMGWSQLNVQPYPAHGIHPYTRCRIIFMNGIEVEGATFLHQFARHTADLELKQNQAMARRAEQEQQKMVNWLIPKWENELDVTIGYEQVAVDLTAWLAQTEPDPYVKAALDFALLEDFDHLYRYANLMDLEHGAKAERLVGEYTEIMPGRPTIAEHRHPFDDVRRFADFDTAELITKLHIMTIIAAEQQTMNFYMNAGNRYMSPLGRGLYLEIAQIEEEHVTHYESLQDPRVPWMERWVMHDYNEAYLYYSCMETETDPRVKGIWEHLLDMEIGHLQADRKLMQQYEDMDPVEMFPAGFPELTIFQPNKDYVRQVLESQVELSANGVEFVPVDDLPQDHRFYQYQQMVHEGPYVPSQEVIRRNIEDKGMDYRWTPEGEHPVRALSMRAEMPPEDVARGGVSGDGDRPSKVEGRAARRTGSHPLIKHLQQEHDKLKQLGEQLMHAEEPAQRKKLRQELYDTLQPHMVAEEGSFYEYLTSAGDKPREEGLKAIQEHHAARLILREVMDVGVEGDTFPAKAHVLYDLNEHHIKEEEGTVLPMLESIASEEELDELYRQYEEVEKEAKGK